MSAIETYLRTKEIEFKSGGTEWLLKTCPFCYDTKWHLYLSKANGLYHCKKCDVKGNFEQFQNFLGDVKDISTTVAVHKNTELSMEYVEKLHQDLLEESDAMNWLLSRGINTESIKYFKLGFDAGWIVIPHIRDGKPINLKFRKIENKEFKRVPGCPSILFNLDSLDRTLKYVILVEGEFDAIKGHQEGIKNILATTVGAETFPYEWVAALEPFEKIFICFDSDKVGQSGAYKAAEKIGLQKCRNIVLPVKDLNDFLNVNTVDDFRKVANTSGLFEVESVQTLNSLVDKLDEYLSNKDKMKGIPTGYEKLDGILKGFQNDDLIIVSGASTVGKTTFLLNCVLDMLKQGKTVLCFFLEGRPMYFVERLITIETGKTLGLIPVDKMEEIKKKLKTYKLFFFSGSQAGLNAAEIVNKTMQCKKVYGIDCVILDHLHKVVERGTDNYSSLVGRAVSDLKNLAVDSKLPIVVVTHIRKFQSADAIPTMQDLRDSSFIHQDADVILMLWANRENTSIRDTVIVKVLKNKTGEDNKELYYDFDRFSGRFTETESDNMREENE